MCETYIECSQHIYVGHRNPETRKTRNDFLVQVQNFLLPLSLKFFRHKERGNTFLCWLFHLCPPTPTRVVPATRSPRASESHPSSTRKTQLFFKIHNILRARFRCMTSFTSTGQPFYLGFLF